MRAGGVIESESILDLGRALYLRICVPLVNEHFDLQPYNGTKRCVTAPKLHASIPTIAFLWRCSPHELIDDLLPPLDSLA
jgi:hypothetical protein